MENWLMINAIIVFTIAFALSSICVPLVIKLAIKKRLLGEYGEDGTCTKAMYLG